MSDINRMAGILAICKFNEGYYHVSHSPTQHDEKDYYPLLENLFAFLGQTVIACIERSDCPSLDDLVELLRVHIRVDRSDFKLYTDEEIEEHVANYVLDELSYWRDK